MDDLNGLRAWDAARELEKVVVDVTLRNKLSDPGGVMSQLCRAANCVGASLAEGVGAATKRERLQCFRRAHREASEIRHHVRSAWDSEFLAQRMYRWLVSRAMVNARMIRGLIVNVERHMPDDKARKARARKQPSVSSAEARQAKRAERSHRSRRRARATTRSDLAATLACAAIDQLRH